MFFESSRRDDSQKKKKDVWKNYNFDAMPELTKKQLQSMRQVSAKEHKKYAEAVNAHLGRPKKSADEKENVVSIRLSETFIKQLKAKAHKKGYKAWQTYAKKILADHINS